MDPSSHARALYNLFTAAAPTSGPSATCAAAVQGLVDECRRHVDAGIPSATHDAGAACAFLLRDGWRVWASIRELWAAYVSSGLIDVNAPVPLAIGIRVGQWWCKPHDTGLPLEVAVINGNVDTLQALLDDAADMSLAPTRDWLRTPCAGISGHGVTRIEDYLDFVRAQASGADARDRMLAMAIAATMSRHMEPTTRDGVRTQPSRRLRAV